MSTLLAEAGIEPIEGYRAENLEPRPDLVIVGNAVPRTNPEAEAVEALGLPRISMPEALYRFFLSERRPLVVSGTHGKTTTTSIASWVYAHCGLDPSYLIGGVPINFDASFHLGTGDRFVIEGDEYNASYFDRGPKFLHYAPETLILTSVEYDHADLYPDHPSLLGRYEELVSKIPDGGHLIACGESEDVRQIGDRARARGQCQVTYYGLGESNDIRPEGPIESSPKGSRLRVVAPGISPVPLELSLFGDHNVLNALAVFAAALRDGIEPQAIARALSEFRGVKRRMEVVAETDLGSGAERGARDSAADQITIIDDFAHHPTAVAATLSAARQSYPGRRIVAAYEPRSLTAGREFLHGLYLEAFAAADRAFFAPIFHHDRLGEERIDLARLREELAERDVEATPAASHEELFQGLVDETRPGDVIVTMSSGSFEGLAARLAHSLVSSTVPA